jgi:hypothetical protein
MKGINNVSSFVGRTPEDAAKCGYPNTETGSTGEECRPKYGLTEEWNILACHERGAEYNGSRFNYTIRLIRQEN